MDNIYMQLRIGEAYSRVSYQLDNESFLCHAVDIVTDTTRAPLCHGTVCNSNEAQFSHDEFASFCDATNLTQWFYREDTPISDVDTYIVITIEMETAIEAAIGLELSELQVDMLKWLTYWVNTAMRLRCPVIMFGE